MTDGTVEIWAEATGDESAQDQLRQFALDVKAGSVIPNEYLLKTELEKGTYRICNEGGTEHVACTAPAALGDVCVAMSSRIVTATVPPTDRIPGLSRDTELWRGISVRYPALVLFVTIVGTISDDEVLYVCGDAFFQGGVVTEMVGDLRYFEVELLEVDEGLPVPLELLSVEEVPWLPTEEIETWNSVVQALAEARGCESLGAATNE